MKYVLSMVFAVCLSGCANFTSPGRHQELDSSKPYWFDYSTERRGAILVPIQTGGTRFLMCSEPVPRVTATLKLKGQAKLTADGTPVKAGEISGQGKADADALNLDEDMMVVFLREALFNLCELSLNVHSIDDKHRERILTLYEKVFEAAVTLSGRNKDTESSRMKMEAFKAYLDYLKQTDKTIANVGSRLDTLASDVSTRFEALDKKVDSALAKLPADAAIPALPKQMESFIDKVEPR